MKHVFLALSLVSFSSGGYASSASPHSEVFKNVCPDESCCQLGDWVARSEVVLYLKPESEFKVGLILKGEKVTAEMGEEHFKPIRIDVIYPHEKFNKGDVILTTHRIIECGLGYWLNGKEAVKGHDSLCLPDALPTFLANCKMGSSAECWGKITGSIDDYDVWWVKVRTRSGKFGWTRSSQAFLGSDSCH